MDLVDYDRGVFDAIVADYRAFTSSIGIADFTAIPLSGLRGDNIAQRTAAMAWYAGPTLIDHLEGVEVDADADRADRKRAVQGKSVSLRVHLGGGGINKKKK